MAKTIKRVTLIFFVLVISCLLGVGCLLTADIYKSNVSSSSLNNYSDGNVQTTADYSVTLSSGNQASKWNEAIQYSLSKGVNVNVTLGANWTAGTDSNYITSFGTGDGFVTGQIYVPDGAIITLDLAGRTLNRNLTTHFDGGRVLVIDGVLNLKDSAYNTADAKKIVDSNGSVSTLSCGKITGGYNATTWGGAIRIGLKASHAVMNMYGGAIYKNKDTTWAGGIMCSNTSTLNIYDGIISENSTVNGGAIDVYTDNAVLNLSGGYIYKNSAHVGAGVYVESVLSKFVMSGGVIKGNTASVKGGGVYIGKEGNGGGYCTINGGVITENTSDIGGGAYLTSTGNLTIGAGAQIFGNKNSSGATNNLEVSVDKKITIDDSLGKDGKTVHVGITLSSGYSGVFTSGYGDKNTIAPTRYFFSDKSGYVVDKSGNELILKSGTTPSSITWRWAGDTSGSTSYSFVALPYTGNQYTINTSAGSFYNENGTSGSSFSISDTGHYYFYTTGNYLNPTFEVIIGDPFKLSKPTAGTTELVYNGEKQTYLPSGFSDLTMNISGNTGTNVGKSNATLSLKTGYYWDDLTNDNLLFNWSINKADLTITIATNNIGMEYNGYPAEIPSSWYTLTCVGLGQDKDKSVETLFKVDKDAFAYQLKQNDNNIDKAINVGTYDIIMKQIDASTVFTGNNNYNVKIAYNNGKLTIIAPSVIRATIESKYSFLLCENDLRVTYLAKRLIHGENDSFVTYFVLGNIPHNTSINEFISNLLLYDKSKIKLTNADGIVVYENGNPQNNMDINDSINTPVGTGWKIDYEIKNGAYEQIYLSVLGDINGDGRITASDVAEVREIAENSILLNSMPLEKKLACMVDNKGSVTYVDSEILRNTINNQLDINLFFESGVNVDSEYKYLTLDKDNLIRGTSETQTNVIGNISVNTSVTTFKEKLAVLGIDTTAITIYDRKGIVVTDDNAIVGTGWRIVTGGKTIYLSVIGDLNGDGRISATDITILRELVTINKSNIADYILLSAIVLNKGGITTADSEVLRVVVNGILQINRY